MHKLFKNSSLFIIFTLCVFEIYIRIFNLYDDIPKYDLLTNNILIYKPQQEGIKNFGNRKELVTKYSINKSGFNSIIEYEFIYNNSIIALIGDSHIEGFHQNVNNSIGRRVEKKSNYIVYEYAISDWNLDDYYKIINYLSDNLNKIENLFIYLSPSDLEYPLNNNLSGKTETNKIKKQNSSLYNIYSSIKTISAFNQTGIFQKYKNKIQSLQEVKPQELTNTNIHLKNFIELNKYYKINNYKKKLVYLVNSDLKFQKSFLEYLYKNFNVIDLSKSFSNANEDVYFKFDKHWNEIGREQVAEEIFRYLKKSRLN